MTSHFKWYPGSEEVVIPWNARFQFPSQANKATKITPRIPPKNGGLFTPGNVIRLEFPAQGYVNPSNTTLEFDVALFPLQTGSPTTSFLTNIRFQNNIQSCFSRVRLLYGATPLEDIINYNIIVRMLTEWSATNHNNSVDQTSIAEGIGGTYYGNNGNGLVAPTQAGGFSVKLFTGPTYGAAGAAVTSAGLSNLGLVNVRQSLIQGISTNAALEGDFGYVPSQIIGVGGAPSSLAASVRRYQVQFLLGLFTQDKLIPTKFMASQLAIEITLATPAQCLMIDLLPPTLSATATDYSNGGYSIFNVNLIPEILEFDSSYDAMFLRGLREGGVPIKFSSWHTFIFSIGGQQNINLLIQERSRSVKSLFAVQRRGTPSGNTDSGALLYTSLTTAGAAFTSATTPSNTLQNYQYRIGGRYFPAQPVQLSTTVGNAFSNGGAEAFLELQKALNTVGDYRLSTSVSPLNWALPFNVPIIAVAYTVPIPGEPLANTISVGELDYQCIYSGMCPIAAYNSSTQVGPSTQAFMSQAVQAGTTNISGFDSSGFSGNLPSSCFAMAINLETSNGLEISGLNAEEQSDISLIANYSHPQAVTSIMEVYSFFDAMIILRENNVIELIQ